MAAEPRVKNCKHFINQGVSDPPSGIKGDGFSIVIIFIVSSLGVTYYIVVVRGECSRQFICPVGKVPKPRAVGLPYHIQDVTSGVSHTGVKT